MNTIHESLFSRVHLYADIASNHRGKLQTFKLLRDAILAAGAIPKIQLFNERTFPRKWIDHLEPSTFVPSVFRTQDIAWVLPYMPLALKIASVESTHWELVNACMDTKLPLIISTGGINEDELMQLLELVQDYDYGLCMMDCVSLYPPTMEQLNMNRLVTLAEALDDLMVPAELGWSTHLPTPAGVSMALALGATQIELHVRPDVALSEKSTEDERSALCVGHLEPYMELMQQCVQMLGDGELLGADRQHVVEWRKRWQS